MLPVYTSYLSSAVPWLEERWEGVYGFERECREEWVGAMNERQEGQVGIYDLRMFIFCSQMEEYYKEYKMLVEGVEGEGSSTVTGTSRVTRVKGFADFDGGGGYRDGDGMEE